MFQLGQAIPHAGAKCPIVADSYAIPRLAGCTRGRKIFLIRVILAYLLVLILAAIKPGLDIRCT